MRLYLEGMGCYFEIQEEIAHKITDFLMDYPEQKAALDSKLSQMIDDIITQERYERQIAAYWKERRA